MQDGEKSEIIDSQLDTFLQSVRRNVCTLTYQHIFKVCLCNKRQNLKDYVIHTKRNPRLNLTQKEKMKNELMNETGTECPKEAGCVGIVSHWKKVFLPV